jgi:hypothetical protein
MSTVDENAQLEAIVELRTLIEDVTRLSEELKLRQERLQELLAPSEAALRARTEYLDQVTRAELGTAARQVSKLGEDVDRTVRSLSDNVVQTLARLHEADVRRSTETRRRERFRTAAGLLVMLLGGFLAGELTNWRSGRTASAASVEERTSATKSAPRRPAVSSTKPDAPTR